MVGTHASTSAPAHADALVAPSATVEDGAYVDSGAQVWDQAVVRAGARVGAETILGRGVYVGPGARLGKRCKVQNHALVYEPAVVGDGVFIGPAVVLTNDTFPRAVTPDGRLKGADDWTAVGVTIDEGASVVPARQVGWVGRAGVPLVETSPDTYQCPRTGTTYAVTGGQLVELAGEGE